MSLLTSWVVKVLEWSEHFFAREGEIAVAGGREGSAPGEPGASAWGCAAAGGEGCGGKGGAGWFPFPNGAAGWGLDSAGRWVIPVQAHFWLCGYESIDCHPCALSHCLQEDDRRGSAPSANKL